MRTNDLRRLVPLALLAAGPAWAAGGHHSVDDAGLLDPGQCEQETWFSRASGNLRLLHAGLNCRVGPVELGVAGEHGRGGGPSQTAWNLEAKWAREIADGWSVGAVVQPSWQAHVRPRYAATVALALLTWTPRKDLAFHLNAGRDFVHRGANLKRGGIAAEWSPADRWWLTAERYLEQDTHFARAGARWAVSDAWTVDFSRAQRLSGPNPSTWTLGVSFGFGGD